MHFRNLRRLTVYRGVQNPTLTAEYRASCLAQRDKLQSLIQKKRGASFEAVTWKVDVWDQKPSLFPRDWVCLSVRLTYTYRASDRSIEEDVDDWSALNFTDPRNPGSFLSI